MKIIRSSPALRKLPFFQRKLPFHPQEFLRIAACSLMALQLSFAPILSAAPAENSSSTKTSPANASDPILKVMQSELSRASTSLAKSDPAPYFLSYTVNDQDIVVLVGAYGSLLTNPFLHPPPPDVAIPLAPPPLDQPHAPAAGR